MYPGDWRVFEQVNSVYFAPIGGDDFDVSISVYDATIKEAEALLPILSVSGREVIPLRGIEENAIFWDRIEVAGQIVHMTYRDGKTYAVQFSTSHEGGVGYKILSMFAFN